MLYKFLFYPARIALWFYCKSIKINKRGFLTENGPLLIAANHPNSFLDAIILSSLFKKPIYALARGDAFSKRIYHRILSSLNMMPVYRVSEGVENLGYNYSTFDMCQKLFSERKIVLIFSEGLCINEWHLRPLKKGTARLAFNALDAGIPLRILPLGINYSSFKKFGKIVHLNFGDIINPDQFSRNQSDGKLIAEFNYQLKSQLTNLVYEIESDDILKVHQIFSPHTSVIVRIILAIPALLGFILHAPLVYAIHYRIKKDAVDHYDSVMVGLLFLLYPFYLVIVSIIFLFICGSKALWLFLLMPLTALSLLHWRKI